MNKLESARKVYENAVRDLKHAQYREDRARSVVFIAQRDVTDAKDKLNWEQRLSTVCPICGAEPEQRCIDLKVNQTHTLRPGGSWIG